MPQQIRKYGRNVTFPTSYFVKLNYKIVKNQSRPITSHEIEGVIKFPSKEKPKADGITGELCQSLKKTPTYLKYPIQLESREFFWACSVCPVSPCYQNKAREKTNTDQYS